MIIPALKVLNFVLFALYFPGSHLYVLATVICFLLSLRGYRVTRKVRSDVLNTFDRSTATYTVLVRTPKYTLREYAQYSEFLGPIEYNDAHKWVVRPGMCDVGIQLNAVPTEWVYISYVDWYTPTETIWTLIGVLIALSLKSVAKGFDLYSRLMATLGDALFSTVNKSELDIAPLEDPRVDIDQPENLLVQQHRQRPVMVDFGVQAEPDVEEPVDIEEAANFLQLLLEQAVLLVDQRGQFADPHLLILIFVMIIGALGEAPPDDWG